MPYGPKGEWRPADPIAAAVHIGKLMVGETEEVYEPPKNPRQDSVAAEDLLRHFPEMAPERRSERASAAAKARWSAKRSQSPDTGNGAVESGREN